MEKPSLIQIATGVRSGKIKRKDLPERTLKKVDSLLKDLKFGGEEVAGRKPAPKPFSRFTTIHTRAVRQ